MKKTEGRFSSFDGTQLFYRYYDRGPNSGRLLVLHGHGEHSGRYEKLVTVLEDQNLSIAMFDFRGTGRSGGRHVYVERFDDYLRDLSAFVRLLETDYNWTKFILLGHSLGGLTAIHWSLQFASKVQAMILSSPCFGLKLPKILRFFNQWMERLNPGFTYQNPVYPPYLTHDPDEVVRYRQDPLVRRKITARLLEQMFQAMERLDGIDEMVFGFPVYMLLAGMEKVVDKDQTLNIFRRIHAPDKAVEIFEQCYHEIFNEMDQGKVFESLKKHLASAYGRSGGGQA